MLSYIHLQEDKVSERTLSVFLPTPLGRNIFIGDIHGCAKTFEKLIEKVALTRKDRLILLGDYINKGKNSKAVLELILRLMNERFKIVALRGNHENMLSESLMFRKEVRERRAKESNAATSIPLPRELRPRSSRVLYNENGELPDSFFNLLNNMPHYAEGENFFAVHAGFRCFSDGDLRAKNNIFDDRTCMLWLRNFSVDEHTHKEIFAGKKIFIGHTPTHFDKISEALANNAPVICLDNGCVSRSNENEGFGNLLAYDFTNGKLFVQENID
jgi:serine/threonine protein phosphatase 1